MKMFKQPHYEKVFDVKEKTVTDYQNIINEANKAILDIQAKCKHPETEVSFYTWRPGDMQPSVICKTCFLRLKDATPEEGQKLWDRFFKR